MGLDAAVYRRLDELPLNGDDLRSITVDPTTGEIDFEDATLSAAWRDRVRIVKRIGNIALVDLLKAEVEEILGPSSSETLLISKVLYSGTHTGDAIPKEQSGSLKDEVALVRALAAHQMSSEIKNFLADMEELAIASQRHGNPIVFV